MSDKRVFLALTLALLVSMSAIGCGVVPGTSAEVSDVPAPLSPVETQIPQDGDVTPQPTSTDEPPATPEEEATPTEDSPTYSSIEVPEAGLTFEMPEPWVRLDPDWTWVPEIGSELQVGVKWLALEPPQEVEAVMLPGSSEVVSAESIELGLGVARRFLVNVFGPATEGSDEQAPIDSVQTHILLVLEQSGARLAYDFFAAGADAEQLDLAESVLEHLVASVSAQLSVIDEEATPSAGVPAPDVDIPGAAAQAIAILARHLDMAQDTIEVVEWEYVEWSDACLGIHTAGTMCAQVITPGYRITLTVGGMTFELHTNQDGSSVGIVPDLIP